MTALLEVEGLSVDLPVSTGTLQAVRDLSLTVQRGETMCLVGESGSGKTMTTLALLDLLPRGARRTVRTLRFAGRDLKAIDPAGMNALRGDRLGVVFQEPATALNPVYSIGEQLIEVHRRHRPRETVAAARDRAVHLLERVGIADAALRLSHYPHQLSGGQRQRTMIAMALMCGPDLLIADEPTSALDATVQAQMLRLLAGLRHEFGLAMLLITHDLGLAAQIADRVAVMQAGRIVETGSPAEIFTRPAHPHTRDLMTALPRPGRAAPASAQSEATAPIVIEAKDVVRDFTTGGGLFGVRRSFTAVDGVSLSIRRGDILGVVGESGAGKTTLARLLAGLLSPSRGAISLDGTDIAQSDRRIRARRIQPVFQDPYASLNPRHRIQAIIGGPLAAHAVGDDAEQRRRIGETMSLVGLPERLAGSYPAELSGGQRQRVAIARALILRPDILVCDEPTSSLDVSIQAQILDLLRRLHRELDLTIVFISHNLAVVESIATRVAVMQRGRIVEQGNARQLFAAPSHPYTKELLAAVLPLPAALS